MEPWPLLLPVVFHVCSYSPRRSELEELGSERCGAALTELEFGSLAPQFRESRVDGDLLFSFSLEELVTGLGMTRLQAKKVVMRQKR